MKNRNEEVEDIDFVVLWVDGADPEWQKEKNKYSVKKDADGSIYRCGRCAQQP